MQEAKGMMWEANCNDNGFIDLDEFMEAMGVGIANDESGRDN